ncbi:MAG: hypothetical protein MJ223_01295 [Mycoplasmoidaceae bacterium]|nr:hypothetical protein [Mycoplasmoidaceae bacterium]
MTNQFTDSQLKLLSDHLEQIKNDDALYNQLIKLPDFKSHIEYLIHKINNIINQIDAQFRSGGGYYNSEISYKNSNCFICNSLFDSILIYSNYLTEMLKINKYSVSKIIESPFTI